MEPHATTTSRATRALRGLALASFAVVMLGGPFVNQVVLDHPQSGLPAWRMFSGKSLGACQTEFRRRHDDGREERLDRFALLSEPRYGGKESVRRMKHGYEAKDVARRLCEVLGVDGSPVDVRMHRRCADLKTGWHVIARGEENQCTSSSTAPEDDEARPRRRP